VAALLNADPELLAAMVQFHALPSTSDLAVGLDATDQPTALTGRSVAVLPGRTIAVAGPLNSATVVAPTEGLVERVCALDGETDDRTALRVVDDVLLASRAGGGEGGVGCCQCRRPRRVRPEGGSMESTTAKRQTFVSPIPPLSPPLAGWSDSR